MVVTDAIGAEVGVVLFIFMNASSGRDYCVLNGRYSAIARTGSSTAYIKLW